VLIDPFSDPETLGPSQPPGVLAMLFPFVMSLVYQARYKPVDIALAKDPDVYSRFLIAPFGPAAGALPIGGSRAIASGSLGGFGGFVDRRFLEYDYRLGRRNAYEFLDNEFLLPEGNPLFKSWTAEQRSRYRTTGSSGQVFLPIVPLMAEVPVPPIPQAKDWPRLDKLPDELPGAIEQRLQAIYDMLTEDLGMLSSAYLALGWRLNVRGALRDRACSAIADGLETWKLL
jgi:hypothetical protein